MVRRIESNGATETTRLLPASVDNSVQSRVQRWSLQIGIALATFSGFLFTANNFLIQYFAIGALEILLVRSIVQVNLVGLVAAIRGTSLSPAAFSTWTLVAAQAFLSSITLYLSYRCLAFLPLGDALTMIFSAPLFTVLLSLIFFRIRIGLLKGGLCLVLFGGVVLNVKPPFLFPQNSNDTILWNSTSAHDFGAASLSTAHPHSGHYFVGVALALGCALSGSLKAIVIRRLSGEIDATALVFYAGLGGIGTALLVSCADGGVGRLAGEIKKADAELWAVLMAVSALGMLGYYTFVASLKFISATLNVVTGTIEIVLAYLCQIAFMGVWPDAIGVSGAVLVLASVVGIALEERYIGNRSHDDAAEEEEQRSSRAG